LTFYSSLSQVPSFSDYAMKGRTYRYFSDKPLYSFGFGLSYTNFAYSNIKLTSSSVKAGDPVTIEGEVKNAGSADGDEVVELYLSQPKASGTPIRVLAGFTRVHLAAGQSTHVGLTIDPRSIAQVDSKGSRVILPGDYTVSLGGAQPGDAAAPVQTGTFTITGKAELPK
jgi:beta-glucosidase